METPGSRLKTIRKHLGLTQGKLGERLGLAWYQVKNMELGTVNITPSIAKLIFYETGYNTDWLLRGEGEMKKNISIDHNKVVYPDISPKTPDTTEGKIGSSVDRENDSFTDRLREVINKAGGQDKLAVKSGISKSTISKYSLGLSDPTRKKLIALAAAGNVNIEWLINGTNKRDREPLDTALIFTLLKITEEIVEYNKISTTPEKKVKSAMYVYQDIKDEVYGYNYTEETIKKQLCKYLDLAK